MMYVLICFNYDIQPPPSVTMSQYICVGVPFISIQYVSLASPWSSDALMTASAAILPVLGGDGGDGGDGGGGGGDGGGEGAIQFARTVLHVAGSTEKEVELAHSYFS